ncbi:MAG: hypothetical protein MJ234_04685 [bacterium]|nr:hypothetical protein [bacterium]
MTAAAKSDFQWFKQGDINGFFALMIDNLAVLAFLSGTLVAAFGFPADIIFTKMFPGTAIGVLFGDFVYSWMAYKLYQKTGNKNITAMPLGLDTPSTIGIGLVVLGPVFLQAQKDGMNINDAAHMSWYVGMATMVLTGIFKGIMAFFSEKIRQIVPQAGLLGSLAGIGIGLLGFGPLLEIFSYPVIGLIAFGLVLYNLIAKIRLPKQMSGLIVAIIAGTIIYHINGAFFHFGENVLTYKQIEPFNIKGIAFPLPTLDFIKGFMPALQYLPISIPFAILTVIGGINSTESAKAAGDDFDTRNIILTEAAATLVAGLFGGVAQTTPYIGHPAYKKMGAGAGYTILTGLFIGFCGIFGIISFFFSLIPMAVLAPILLFVAIEIIAEAFVVCPKKHAPAVALALFPTVARLLAIKYGIMVEGLYETITATEKTIHSHALPEPLTIIALGNGFIVTAMLWGGMLAEMIDGKIKKASMYCIVLAALAFFGIIHSADPNGNMYLPWTIEPMWMSLAFQYTAGYIVMGLMIYMLSFTKEAKEFSRNTLATEGISEAEDNVNPPSESSDEEQKQTENPDNNQK